MFSKNLKYYRLKKNMTKKALADAIHVSAMAITHYEDGSRRPGMETLSALAVALGVRVSDFLAVRNEEINFQHGEFRKSGSLTQMQQEFVKESVEEYFGRFYTVVEALGGEVLPDAPACHVLPLSEDDEENALAMRKHLGFAAEGPIENLAEKLENKGILIYDCPMKDAGFYGMNGLVNERPYIVLNPGMSAERNRSTSVHELAHLMFDWPGGLSDKDAEERATAIGGAFLFPRNDAIRELGIKRTSVTKDMSLVAEEYGISMMMLVTRAYICGIISKLVSEIFFVAASHSGWKDSEPSRIKQEKPQLFEKLVYRAVNENEISAQRGAELLQCTITDIQAMQISEV